MMCEHMVYCPTCDGRLVTPVGIIVHPPLDADHPAVAYEQQFVCCLNCSLVSQVNPVTGLLIDLGHVTLTELVEGLPEPRALRFSSTSRLRYRDS